MDKHNKIYPIIDDNLLSYESELISIVECNSCDIKKTKHIRRMSSAPVSEKKYRKSQKIDIITPIVHNPTYTHTHTHT